MHLHDLFINKYQYLNQIYLIDNFQSSSQMFFLLVHWI